MPLSLRFTTMRSRVSFVVLWPVDVVRDAASSIGRTLRLMLLRHRTNLIRSRGVVQEGVTPARRIIVVVTHVVGAHLSADERRGSPRLGYLRRCLDAVLTSLAHLDPEVVINTFAGRNLIAELPEYLRKRCRVVEHTTGDPMMIEFTAQEIFLQNASRFDWFLFLEDDIAIHDPMFVEKIADFSARCGRADALLVPHRFEMNLGRKHYIDRDFENVQWRGASGSPVVDVMKRSTMIRIDNEACPMVFAEFTNPHAACYLLDRQQLARWNATGRHWHGKVTWIGPLESAATGSLFEAFDVFKPHADSKHYLEVEHLEPKYSARYLDALSPKVAGDVTAQ